MRRPVGVVFSAIVQFMGSLFVLLPAVGMFVLPHWVAAHPIGQPAQPVALFFVMGGFYVLLSVLGIATGIGLLRMRKWARISTLIFAACLAFMGITMALMFAFILLPAAGATASENTETILKLALVSFLLAIVLLGAWWLYYFNRKSTRASFEASLPIPLRDENGRPISILIIAMLNFFALPALLVGALQAFPILFFGGVVRGGAARLVYVLFFAVQLYIGIGLVKLIPKSRVVAIAFYLLGVLNVLLSFLVPGRDGRVFVVMAESLRIWHLPAAVPAPQVSTVIWGVLLTSTIFSAIVIYFLVTRQAAFNPPAKALEPSPS